MNETDHIYLYYFGAGASNQVLPLSTDFSDRLIALSKELEEHKTTYDQNNILWKSQLKNLSSSLKWLADETSVHDTVDTFAKKLFLGNDLENFKKLKDVLSTFLFIEQSRKHVDKRYDSFFASILRQDQQKKVFIPENIIIFTWNYDVQLEKSFWGICKDVDWVQEKITDNNLIHRINGSCGTFSKREKNRNFLKTVSKTSNNEALEAGIYLYAWLSDQFNSNSSDICFAWEDKTKTRLKNVLPKLFDVTDIIIIGYSFPYFNREIDNEIFKNFGVNLKQVFLQVLDEHYSSIKDRLPLLPPNIDLIRIPQTKLFHIPDTFNRLT